MANAENLIPFDERTERNREKRWHRFRSVQKGVQEPETGGKGFFSGE